MVPALVLTAGLGTRLDPLTRLVAKPAVPIGSRTLVERVLAWLERQDITNLVLNLHYRPETITGVIGDGAHLGLHVRYSWEHPLLGSAGGPRRALSLLDAPTFLIVNGDTLCEIDLAPMIAAHERSQALATLALVPNAHPDRYNGVVLGDDDVVRGFLPKGTADQTWHFVGIQVVNASAFAQLPDGVPAETVAGIYREYVTTQPGSIRGWRVSVPFVDVGTPRDYLEASLNAGRIGSAGEGTSAVGTMIDPSAQLIRSVVWPGSRVGAGAELDMCIVAGVEVPPRFTASQAVLVPSTLVRPGDRGRVTDGIAVFPL